MPASKHSHSITAPFILVSTSLQNLLQFRDGHGRLPHQAALAGKDSSSPAEVEIVLSLLKEAEDRIAYHDAVLKRIELDETPVKCTQGCGWTGKE